MTYSFAHVTEVSTVVLEGEIGPGMVLALKRQICDALPVGRLRIVVDMHAVTVLPGLEIAGAARPGSGTESASRQASYA